jgi:hypothetical protein
MDPHITAAEALAVFRRKLPGAVAEARQVHHPFWWAALRVRTRGLLRRSSEGPGQSMNVLVNAVSGRAMIADFAPAGTAVTGQQWSTLLDEHGDRSRMPSRFEADRAARALARAKVVRDGQARHGHRDLTGRTGKAVRGLLKPNWLVSGANAKHSATILVDGLDSSHFIVRVERLSPSSSHP